MLEAIPAQFIEQPMPKMAVQEVPKNEGGDKEEPNTVDATQGDPSAEVGVTIERFQEVLEASTKHLGKTWTFA